MPFEKRKLEISVNVNNPFLSSIRCVRQHIRVGQIKIKSIKISVRLTTRQEMVDIIRRHPQ